MRLKEQTLKKYDNNITLIIYNKIKLQDYNYESNSCNLMQCGKYSINH